MSMESLSWLPPDQRGEIVSRPWSPEAGAQVVQTRPGALRPDLIFFALGQPKLFWNSATASACFGQVVSPVQVPLISARAVPCLWVTK